MLQVLAHFGETVMPFPLTNKISCVIFLEKG